MPKQGTLKSDQQGNCKFCHQQFQSNELFPASMIRPAIGEFIRKEKPDWSNEGFICHVDLTHFRTMYVEQILATERGELTSLETDVLESLRQHETLARNINDEADASTTLGDRFSDHLASFGGSWMFLISFGAILAVWITINSLLFLWRPFDPYPFILLNLVLSCLAAIQAPVIMMSQNRQETKIASALKTTTA